VQTIPYQAKEWRYQTSDQSSAIQLFNYLHTHSSNFGCAKEYYFLSGCFVITVVVLCRNKGLSI